MKFLAVTDLHYTDKPKGDGDREHELSLKKLGYALRNFSYGCDFIMNLGDTADSFEGFRDQRELFCEACGVFKSSGMPFYSIIGNHDTAINKHEFCCLMASPGRYYSFSCKGYKCIVLDACLNDINEPYPDSEIEWDNCNIDPGQKQWFADELANSAEPVLVFTHTPFVLEERAVENPHLIINRDEIMDIMEKSGKVKAVFSGHYHFGCSGVVNGIPHIVFASMCLENNNSFAVVTVENDMLLIEGKGLVKSQKYKLL